MTKDVLRKLIMDEVGEKYTFRIHPYQPDNRTIMKEITKAASNSLYANISKGKIFLFTDKEKGEGYILYPEEYSTKLEINDEYKSVAKVVRLGAVASAPSS